MSQLTTVQFTGPTLPSETYLAELGDEGPPYTISGIALGVGDVTKGKSGIKKKWPADELKAAAESLQGTNLVVNHENSAEGVVGTVTKAGYKDGSGVIYEAELYDEELAEKIQNGLLEVSVRGLHRDVDNLEEDPETEALVVEDIEFKNLSIVPSGASPSNTLEMGEHAELSEAELQSFTESLDSAELETDLEPGSWVEWGDKHGIIISQVEGQEEVEVDVYEEVDGKWRAIGQVETVDLDDLNKWDVSEDDIGARKESDEKSEEENAELSEGDWVTYTNLDDEEVYGKITSIDMDDGTPVATIQLYNEDGSERDKTAERPVSILDQWDDAPSGEEMAAIRRGQFVKWKDVDNNWKYGQVINVKREGSQMVATLRRFTASGDKLNGTAEKPVQGLDIWDDAPLSESDQTDSEVTESGSADSDGPISAPEWSEGQMVRWQVNPSMMGKIVHVDREKKIVMVEVMEEQNGEITSSGFTVTAGYSDLKPVSEEANASTTADVPVQDARPSHDPVGSDFGNLLDKFIEEFGTDSSIEEFGRWLAEANLSDRVEGEERLLDNPKAIREMREASKERFIEKEPDEEELEERYDDYPEAASKNAQMALDAREDTGNPNDCGTDVGWKRAKQLANGEGLTREQIGKMSAFNRHRSNSEMDDDEGRADCGWMMWKAWGGDEGVDWAQRKLDQIEEENADSAELQDYEMHEPEYSGTTEREWSRPNLEDFVSEMNIDGDRWSDLTDEQQSSIEDHFIIAEGGFPVSEYGQLNLPVVEPDGDLNINALAAAKGGHGVSAVEGLSSEMEAEIVSMINDMANNEFDRNWGDEEKNAELAEMEFSEGDWVMWDWSGSTAHGRVEKTFSGEGTITRTIEGTEVSKDSDEQPVYLVRVWNGDGFDGRALRQQGARNLREWNDHPDEDEIAESEDEMASRVRVLPGDDLQTAALGASEQDSLQHYKVDTMNDELESKLEELEEPVAVEADELQQIKDKANQFDELSDNIEALRERTEILDEVDRDAVEELRDADDPVVVESARYEELTSEAEQVKGVYAASLAEEMPGFTAEELSENFSIEELREKHEEVIGSVEEELASSEEAEPRSTDPSEEELEEANESDDSDEAELEAKAEQKRQEIRDKILSDD